MSTGLIVVLVIVAAAAAGVALRSWWCRRNPKPLRGDWWSDFERDFRRWAAAHPPHEHRRRSPRRGAF